MKKSSAWLVLSAASFVLLTGFHGHCGDQSPEARAKRVQRMASSHTEDFLDDVDATEDQKVRVNAIKDRLLVQGVAQFADHQKAKQDLIAEWKSKQPDSAKVHAVIDARVDSIRALLHQVADGVIELHGILTPEQREEINQRFER